MASHDHRLFAELYDPVMALWEATVLAPHRRYLTNGISGRILDLGAGTGPNLPYFDAVARTASARNETDRLDVHLVEPDRHMRERALEATREVRDSSRFSNVTQRASNVTQRASNVTQQDADAMDVTVVGGQAEALPYCDDRFDVVLSSLVGCTIRDLDAALDEIVRVLRPGGEFRFLEHVHAGGVPGRIQSAIDPLWTRVAAGCHLDRDLETTYRECDGFDVRTVEQRWGIPPASPFIRGVAVATDAHG